MTSSLSLVRSTSKRRVASSLFQLLTGRPKPLVYEARNALEYRTAALEVARRNSVWLRRHWSVAGEAPLARLRGYCAVCRRWTSFEIDASVCSEWEGRRVPWWTNTLSCPDCKLAARMRAALHLVEGMIAPTYRERLYITEQTTPLYEEFNRRYPHLLGSEYLVASTPRGQKNGAGIRCEDLTDLTFADASFDCVLSFEVFEHVPDYERALCECARVIKPGGMLVCSVPFHGKPNHKVRAIVADDGSIQHLLPPEYHGDPVNPNGVLCYRYFGLELLADLRRAGFRDACAWLYWSAKLGYLGEDRVLFVAVR